MDSIPLAAALVRVLRHALVFCSLCYRALVMLFVSPFYSNREEKGKKRFPRLSRTKIIPACCCCLARVSMNAKKRVANRQGKTFLDVSRTAELCISSQPEILYCTGVDQHDSDIGGGRRPR